MDLRQGQFTSQTLRQEQTLSAQQIQALNILAAPVLELNQLINQEMEANPVLEMEDNFREESLDATEDRLLDDALQLDSYADRGDVVYSSPEDEAKRQHFFDSLTSSISFEENLITQLRLHDLDESMLELCLHIVSEVDSSGYLITSDDELSEMTGKPVKEVKKAVKVVQQLEPAGVAARNLKERLLIQLKRSGYSSKDILAVVRDHLDDLGANRLPQICRKLHISMERLTEITEVIKTLRPSLDEASVSPVEYVQEDLVVKIVNGEPVVEMLNSRLPSLKVSSYYKKLVGDSNLSQEDERFIKTKITSALEFMKKIHNRQSTIEKIAGLLVKTQRQYFFEGEKALVPLTMVDVAEAIGCHETTVSRAVASKYLRCSFGLVPLRKFFSSSVITVKDGEDVAGAAIKEKIRQIIANEESTKPLSDNKIAQMLENDGIKVARRTVAKYRESMGIAATSRRKKFL